MPGIYVGTSEIKNIYVGTTPVKEVYLGDAKIRPSVIPITTPGIYHNPDLGLISLSSDGSNWLTIADKNLGATTVYNYGDTMSGTNCGGYFQRGNNYMFPFTGSVTTSSTKVDTSTYGPGNYYSSPIWITASPREISANTNLWGGDTGTYIATRGPCNSGFHILSKSEGQLLINTGIALGAWAANDGISFSQYLKIPMGGLRINSTAETFNQGSSGYLWTSDTSTLNVNIGENVNFDNTSLSSSLAGKNNGHQIRPFKNGAVQPDSSWTVIYQ